MNNDERHVWILDGELYVDDDGNLVEIRYDYDCENPRRDDDGIYSTFLTWARGYSSPDENPYDYPDELAGDMGIYDEDGCNGSLFDLIRGMNEMGWVALPVSMVDHSSIAYRAGHPSQFVGAYPWDAGYVGLIYASESAIKEGLMVDEVTDEIRERVIGHLENEVRYYSDWADGTCYGFVKYDRHGEEIDSCWGFIGDDATTNGIEDHVGRLHECSYHTVEEYVEDSEGKVA